eukprot:gene1836-2061_t
MSYHTRARCSDSLAWTPPSKIALKHAANVRHTQGAPSKFPDAKVVRSTNAQHVLPALGDIYSKYGNPEEHKIDNGPPFNNQEFNDFSASRGISVKHPYPYHLQGNEAECFMKSLGKAVKIALNTNKQVQEAVDDLLINYRSTPHLQEELPPATCSFELTIRITNETPGNRVPAPAKPKYSNAAHDLSGNTARRRNRACINQSHPTAHSANEDLTPEQTDELTIPTPPLPLAESHDGEQPAHHETKPDITFCHP